MSQAKHQKVIGLLSVTLVAMMVWSGVGDAATSPAESPEEITLNEISELSDYLAYGALKSPELEAAFYRWQAAESRTPQAEALPNPTLTFGYFIREIETRVGAQRARVGISQMFPWFGKRRLRGEIATGSAEAARAAYEATKCSLFLEIERAYWNYWYLSRSIETTGAALELADDLEAVVRKRYTAGRAPYATVMKAQMEVAKFRDRLASLKDQRVAYSAGLDAAIGRPIGGIHTWPNEDPVDRHQPALLFEDIFETAKETFPGLHEKTALMAREEASMGLARKQSYPDFGVGFDYIITDKALAGTPEGNGKDAVAVVVSLSLPIFVGTNRAAVREAEANYHASVNEYERAVLYVGVHLQRALTAFREAGRRELLYDNELLPKARQALAVTRQSYEAGESTFLDVVDAEQTLLDFELSLARARADRAIQGAELRYLTGMHSAEGAGESKENGSPDKRKPGEE